MTAAFEPLLEPPPDHAGDTVWVCVRGTSVLLADPDEADVHVAARHFLGLLHGHAWWAADVGPGAHPDVDAREGFLPLMALYGRVPEEEWVMAGRGVQLVEWERTHRFCGRCATPTEAAGGERARRCPACGLLAFPRLAPAVIVLVERGDEVLLARGRQFPVPMYSCLAGFVEPGETLEHTVQREVREEVGVELADVRYAASQPWPFPHSLMIGFTARWASGDIRIDETELVDAQWFTADTLPAIPPRLSIARHLIDDWIDRR